MINLTKINLRNRSNVIKNNSSGFTIVELMIVLAIAGIILLLVFEAVPTLDRSGRNNQREQDVSTILNAVSHYELNNSGNFPEDCGGASPHNCTSSAGASSPNDYFLHDFIDKLTYYTNNQVTLLGGKASTTLSAAQQTPDINHVYLYNYQKCDPNNPGGSTPNGAGYNDIVALYATETGSVNLQKCQQL